MGTNTITQIGTTTPVEATGNLVDQYLTAIATDFVPRTTAGVVTTIAGGVGTASFSWNSAGVGAGGVGVGWRGTAGRVCRPLVGGPC